jgi:hypothetical protein
VRRNTLVDRVEIRPVRESNVDVGVLEPESRVDVRRDFVISFDNVLDIQIDEVVKRVYMLFDESLYFKKSGEQKPFILVVWSYVAAEPICFSGQTDVPPHS